MLFKQDTSRIKASNKNGDDSEIKQALLFHSHECRPWNPDLFYLFILMGGAHIFGIDACTRTGFFSDPFDAGLLSLEFCHA